MPRKTPVKNPETNKAIDLLPPQTAFATQQELKESTESLQSAVRRQYEELSQHIDIVAQIKQELDINKRKTADLATQMESVLTYLKKKEAQ